MIASIYRKNFLKMFENSILTIYKINSYLIRKKFLIVDNCNTKQRKELSLLLFSFI